MNRRALFSVVKGFAKGTDLVCAGGCKAKTIDAMQLLADNNSDDIGEKSAVPYKKYPVAPDATKWSFTSADGNAILGDPPNWARYQSVHAWFDIENSETRGAYKLPHHKMIEGSIKTV